MVGDEPGLHHVAQGSQTGPRFPETYPRLEDMVMNHLAHILRDWDAFLVGDDPRLSRVDESSQSGTSFPESGTSFESCWILLIKCPTPFMQIRERIQELGEEYRIGVRFKSERGTSKHCSLCGEKHKNGRKHRGLYHCKTHNILMNADVNGAYNILYGRKVAAGSGSRPMAWPMLLRWDGCGWNRNNGMPTQAKRIRVEA